MFLLDTNAWVAVLRGKSPEILAELKRHAPAEMHCVPSCSRSCGTALVAAILLSAVPIKRSSSSYASAPFDDAAAIDAGQIRADLAATGTPIGPYDLLIAAIARSQHLTLVTHNTAEFARVHGLMIEDWQI